jgi:hypothetical protein
VFCPCRSALVGPDHHSAKKPPLGLKSIESDHEIMQNGIICLIWLKKCSHSSNPAQNPAPIGRPTRGAVWHSSNPAQNPAPIGRPTGGAVWHSSNPAQNPEHFAMKLFITGTVRIPAGRHPPKCIVCFKTQTWHPQKLSDIYIVLSQLHSVHKLWTLHPWLKSEAQSHKSRFNSFLKSITGHLILKS